MMQSFKNSYGKELQKKQRCQQCIERKFYIPHKAVVKESAETAKMWIVYDASARAWPSSLPKQLPRR